MRVGPEPTPARVVRVFWAAHPYDNYLFANARGNRMKVRVHDDCGLWLESRQLTQGRFAWAAGGGGLRLALSNEQLQALVLGQPWERLGSGSVMQELVVFRLTLRSYEAACWR